MAKKNKKSKKLRKKKQSKLLNLTEAQRIEKARQKLTENNAREAISILKTISKNNPLNQEVNDLFFQSYLLREKQLSCKGMRVEAEAIFSTALDYLPDFSIISEEHLLYYMTKTSLPIAADAYLSFLQKKRSSKNAELFLADRICMSGQWKLLSNFDDNHLFRKDQKIIETARNYMVNAQWDEAFNTLKPLSRKSPYSVYKLFCRGMVAFYEENDSEMIQYFERIPEYFSLYPIIQELKVIASPLESFKRKGYAISKIDFLWDGAAHIDRQITQLISAEEKGQADNVISMIQSIAKTLYPKEPEWATLYILLLLNSKSKMNQDDDYFIEDIAEEILSEKQFLLFKTKVDYKHSKWPFLSAARYIDCLSTEFFDKKSQDIAKAMILLQTAWRWHENHAGLSGKGLNVLTEQLNIDHKTNEDLLIELVSKALSLDPENRKGYELLMEIPRTKRRSKNIIENHLLIMLDLFKNDPLPCLELSTIYYEKNAFRKAEVILEEAMNRAPHDNRVIEQHVVSLLISASRNFERNNLSLATRDMERASQIECKVMNPYLIERTILYKTDHSETNLLECINKYTASLSIVDRFRVKTLLCFEKLNRHITKKLINNLTKELLTLSGKEILLVLAPLPKAVIPLYQNTDIYYLFDKNIKDVFHLLDDYEIVLLFDIILSPQTASMILKEIRKRLRNAEPDRALILSFYQVTIWHLENKECNPDMFYKLLDKAKGPVKEELQAISRKMAKHAAGTLKRALETFEFHLISTPFPNLFAEDMEPDDPEDSYADSCDDDDVSLEYLHEDIYDDDDDDDEYFENDISDMMMDVFKKAMMDQFGGMMEDVEDEDDFNLFGAASSLGRELFLLDHKLTFAERKKQPSQELLDEIVRHLEAVIDAMDVRGDPKYLVLEAKQFFMKDPEFQYIFKRLAKLLDKHNVKNISKEAKLILFSSKNRR